MHYLVLKTTPTSHGLDLKLKIWLLKAYHQKPNYLLIHDTNKVCEGKRKQVLTLQLLPRYFATITIQIHQLIKTI